MDVELYRRRQRGQRLARSEESASIPLRGTLSFANVMHGTTPVRLLTLRDLTNTGSSGGLATLYEPEMIGLGNGWISFRGFESVDLDGQPVSYLQEWRCCVKK